MNVRARFLLFSAAILIVAACKKSPSAPLDAAAPIDAGSAQMTAKTPPKDAGAAETAAAEAKARAEHVLYLDAMKRGRTATAKRDFKTAIAAFDEAVSHEPKNAQALGERGYAKYLAGDLANAESDLEDARDCGAAPKLAAQIWFNLALVREKQGDADGARSAFASSQALAPTKAAAARLGGAVACTADVDASPSDDLAAVANWIDAASALDVELKDRTEAAAKNAVCSKSYMFDGSDATHDACDGAPPWITVHDYMMFTYEADIVFPSAKKIFVVNAGRMGGWPAHCQGSTDVTAAIDGDFASMTLTFAGGGSVMLSPDDLDAGLGVNVVDNGEMVCGDGPGFVEDTFYDLANGRELLKVHRLVPIGAKAPDVSLARSGKTVTLSGGGCDKSFDLSALAKTPRVPAAKIGADAGK